MKFTEMMLESVRYRAAVDVERERLRQIDDLGHRPEDDDEYEGQQLARAAVAYAMYGFNPVLASRICPHGWFLPYIMVDRRTQLVRAAALILAEIERLDRKAMFEQEDAQ